MSTAQLLSFSSSAYRCWECSFLFKSVSVSYFLNLNSYCRCSTRSRKYWMDDSGTNTWELTCTFWSWQTACCQFNFTISSFYFLHKIACILSIRNIPSGQYSLSYLIKTQEVVCDLCTVFVVLRVYSNYVEQYHQGLYHQNKRCCKNNFTEN